MNEDWITTGTAAELLGTDRKTVLGLVARGMLVGRLVPTLTSQQRTLVSRHEVMKLTRRVGGWRRRSRRLKKEATE